MPSARVLAVVHWYVPHHSAGAEVMLHAMLRALAERGNRVEVLESSPPKNDSYRHDGYDIDGIRVHPHRSEQDLPEKLAGCDAVVTHLNNVGRCVPLCREAGTPCFIIHHDDYTQPWSADRDIHHVYNSHWLRESHLRAVQAPPTPRHLIVRPPVLSAEYATTPGEKVTLINLNATKGVEVFYALADRMPSIPFLGVVGAYGDQVIHQAPNIEFMGNVHHRSMRQVYAKTRILLMPSRYETWGRTAVEAMASGIPVIASPTSGLMESCGAAGVFVSPDDLDGWQTAITALMDEHTWQLASHRALTRSAELDRICETDLHQWCQAVEDACR